MFTKMASMLKSKPKQYGILILAVFILGSFLFISPKIKQTRSSYNSSQLHKKTVKDANTERTDYLDDDGKITIAADLGYATMIVTKTQSSRLEQYYDDKGEPISRSDGYYAVLREYDEKGNNICNTYLNSKGMPAVTLSGYAKEEREYNENRQVISSRYYDAEGHPALTTSNAYGKINEYNDNGQICKITYVNASGAPMMTGQGYAIVSRNYYTSEGPENGRVESEFYFDESGNPVSLTLGQYGVHKEYDEYGRVSLLTYLDAEGNPTITKKGYTTVRQTFQANNYIATEQYYDQNGNPFALSEGQYGEKKENGQTVYLNQDGKETFNLRNLLYNRSWLVIVLALSAVLLTVLIEKRWNTILLIMCLGAIVYLTLMFRESGEERLRLEPFWSYRLFLTDSKTRADILRNIWLFIPLGAILYRLYPKKIILLVPIVLSIIVEILQYFTGTGLCELDDVISNSLGGFIGYEICKLLCGLKDIFFQRRIDYGKTER